jgi:hypothetical protein
VGLMLVKEGNLEVLVANREILLSRENDEVSRNI